MNVIPNNEFTSAGTMLATCNIGLALIAMPTVMAIGNDKRRTQMRRLILVITRTENPASGTESERNNASKVRSSLPLIRSAILMIFDVKAFPDLFLAAEDDGFHRAYRQTRGVADFAVRQSASVGKNHYCPFLLR